MNAVYWTRDVNGVEMPLPIATKIPTAEIEYRVDAQQAPYSMRSYLVGDQMPVATNDFRLDTYLSASSIPEYIDLLDSLRAQCVAAKFIRMEIGGTTRYREILGIKSFSESGVGNNNAGNIIIVYKTRYAFWSDTPTGTAQYGPR